MKRTDLLLAFLHLELCVVTANRPPDVRTGHPGSSQISMVKGVLGRTVSLPCPVEPVTFLEWTHGGTVVSPSSDITVNMNGAESSLRIKNLQLRDAGVYTCRAVNGFGSFNHNVTLTITDANGIPLTETDTMPTATSLGAWSHSIETPYPENATVSSGAPVVFQCNVKGPHNAPGIIWYKEQSVDGAEDELFIDSSIPVPSSFNQDYKVTGTWLLIKPKFYSNSPVQRNVRFYSKLTIPSASTLHTGRYLCGIMSPSHPVSRTVYLTVQHEPAEEAASAEPESNASWLTTIFGSYSATLAVIIAVPSIVLLLISAAVIYAVNKRKREHRAVKAKWRHQKKLGSGLSEASTRQPSQPHSWPASDGCYSADKVSGGSAAPLMLAPVRSVSSGPSSSATAALLGPSIQSRGVGGPTRPGGSSAALYYSDNVMAPATALQPPYQPQPRSLDSGGDSSDSQLSALQQYRLNSSAGPQPRAEYPQAVRYCYYGNS